MSRPLYLLLITLLAFALAACSGSSTPQMIASYPSCGKTNPPIAPLPPQAQLVFNTDMELEVWNPDTSAAKAQELAQQYGGYMTSWDAWQKNDQTYIRLGLAVPAPYYSALYKDLLGLGTLLNQHTSGEWEEGHYGWDVYSEITVSFQPRAISWPQIKLPFGGWNPFRTFGQAFGVFWSIFGFIVDVLIWVIVVVGPFVLVALGLRALVRRWKK
jgi:hypothetical protein